MKGAYNIFSLKEVQKFITKEVRCMYLGETLEEKRESYELLTRRAKKLGKFFGVLGGFAGLPLLNALWSVNIDNFFKIRNEAKRLGIA